MPSNLLLLAGGLARFVANAVDFDGANDYLTIATTPTGVVDGKAFTISLWVNPVSISSAWVILQNRFGVGGTERLGIFITGGGDITLTGLNAAGSVILAATTTDAPISTGSWQHIAISIDLANASNRDIIVDGVGSAVTYTTYTNDSIDFTDPGWIVGRDHNSSANFIDGDVSEFWFDDSYFDISVAANLLKFRTNAGKPAFLRADGSRATGTSPAIFFTNPTATWHTNAGAGGGFTENGALTDAATSPSG